MLELSLSEARARLPELLDRVAAGEEVHITRHGKHAAVLVDNDRWMKTRTHDVLVQARKLRRDLEEARGKPLLVVPAEHWDVDAHVAEIREMRDDDPWQGIE
ncbi:MAG: type II toxin-antitoxin system Phd/YefM family antitoxin [Salinibacterium sp.]|nr:MAG: type II toxin-antitoxin system Phd/YefM family antitoxin [Salinibacterium sp.]